MEIYLFNKDGKTLTATAGGTNYLTRTVKSNQMLQIDNIVSTDSPVSAFNIGTENPFYGWLLIYSDQPITAWASVIHRVYSGGSSSYTVDDPAIEMAIAAQEYKPNAFMEKTGTRLAILSSIHSSRWFSTLSVANVGDGDGNLTVKFFNSNGTEVGTRITSQLKGHALYYNPDIRNNVSDYGMMVVEISDSNSTDSLSPRIVANSIVRNMETGDSSFFDAFALPPATDSTSLTKSMAGIWTGSLSGISGNVSCTVSMELFQERDALYGTLHIDSGKFPAVPRDSPNDHFLVAGGIHSGNYVLQVEDVFDKNSVMFALRL